MPKRVIVKSSGSKGRVPSAAEAGKLQAKVRAQAVKNVERGDSVLAIDGKFSPQARQDLFAHIDAAFRRFKARNPKAAIDKLEEGRGRITLYVSDAHLALALGKQLHRAHKGGHLTITWSHDDVPVYVHWAAKE